MGNDGNNLLENSAPFRKAVKKFEILVICSVDVELFTQIMERFVTGW